MLPPVSLPPPHRHRFPRPYPVFSLSAPHRLHIPSYACRNGSLRCPAVPAATPGRGKVCWVRWSRLGRSVPTRAPAPHRAPSCPFPPVARSAYPAGDNRRSPPLCPALPSPSGRMPPPAYLPVPEPVPPGWYSSVRRHRTIATGAAYSVQTSGRDATASRPALHPRPTLRPTSAFQTVPPAASRCH